MARKHKVRAGDTYDTIATQYGVPVTNVVNANAGMSSPRGGTYVVVPTVKETSQGAFGAQGAGGGGKPVFSPAFGGTGLGKYGTTIYGYFQGKPQYFDSTQGAQTYQNSERSSTPQLPRNGYNQARDTDLYPQTGATASGGDGGGFGTSNAGQGKTDAQNNPVYTDSERTHIYTADEVILNITNGTPVDYIAPNVYADLTTQGVTESDLESQGYIRQPDGSFIRAQYNPANPSGNAGGWVQNPDGSWHLNRNKNQIRRHEEIKKREAKMRSEAKGAVAPETTATWSIG